MSEPPSLDGARALYHALHSCPELSGQERDTAARFTDWLRGLGCDVATGVGGHGVLAALRNGEGRTVGMRAELDALPIEAAAPQGHDEQPAAHLCGHDMHLACVAATVERLAATRDTWQGTVWVIGQPAEETLAGARAMLADGCYERFGKPDVLLAQHVAAWPCGVLAHGTGPLTSGCVDLDVVVHGSGGHGAVPDSTVDPIVVAASLVLRLQTLVSRESNPFDPVVVTVGALHAGTVGNVIPDEARLSVSVRAYADATLDRLVRAVHRVVRAECAAAACPSEPTITEGPRAPVTVNDPAAAADVQSAHRQAFGEQRVLTTPALLSSEDFGWFGPAGAEAGLYTGKPVPLVYWLLGSVDPERWKNAPGKGPAEKMAALPAPHASTYQPAEATLGQGAKALYAAARHQLEPARR